MGDIHTSLMLLVNKASRKLRRNGLHMEQVEAWLCQLAQTWDARYAGDAAAETHYSILCRPNDAEEPAAFAIAVVSDELTVNAGQGPCTDVAAFAAAAIVEDPAGMVAAARERFTLHDRTLTITRADLDGWSTALSQRPVDAVSIFSTLSAQVDAPETRAESEADRCLGAMLDQAAQSNQTNRLDADGIRTWLSDYLLELDEEFERFPTEREASQWNLVAADWSYEEPTVLCVVLLSDRGARLAAGHGTRDMVHEFGENHVAGDDVIEDARARFTMVDEELVFVDRTALEAWLAG